MNTELALALYRRTIDLNHKEVAVIFALAGAAKNKDTLPSPSIKRLADRAGMAIGTVKDTIKSLLEKQIITVAKRKTASGQNCNLYSVNISAFGQEKPVAESEERVQTGEPLRVQTGEPLRVQTGEPLKSSERVQESSERVQKSSNCGHYNNIDKNINNNIDKTRQDSVVEGGLGGTNQPQPQKLEEPKSQASRSVSSKDVNYPLVFENARHLLVKDGKTEEEAQRLVDLAADDFAKLNDTWRKNGWHKENGEEIGNPQGWLERTLYHKANDKAKEGPKQPQAEEPTSLEEIFGLLKREWAATYPEVAEHFKYLALADFWQKTIDGLRADESVGWASIKGSRVEYVCKRLKVFVCSKVQAWRQDELKATQNDIARLESRIALYKSDPAAYYRPPHGPTREQYINELAKRLETAKAKHGQLLRLTARPNAA